MQRIMGFGYYTLYKSTFYLLTYLLSRVCWVLVTVMHRSLLASFFISMSTITGIFYIAIIWKWEAHCM